MKWLLPLRSTIYHLNKMEIDREDDKIKIIHCDSSTVTSMYLIILDGFFFGWWRCCCWHFFFLNTGFHIVRAQNFLQWWNVCVVCRARENKFIFLFKFQEN